MTTSLLDLDGFKSLSPIPDEDVDLVESRKNGWILAQLVAGTAEIYARIGKRYERPIATPNEFVTRWLADIVTPRVYAMRGGNPNDQTLQEMRDMAQLARDQMKEAADSNTGLFDLPLAANDASTGISKGGPLSFSQQSPYSWTDDQVDTGREEDRNGR